jgi:DNA-3-methyladenine glycosylase
MVKKIAPSTELRKWFHAESEHWDEFKQRYLKELETKQLKSY